MSFPRGSLNVQTVNYNDPHQLFLAEDAPEPAQPYDYSATTDPLATAVLGIETVVNNVMISHPCTVLRRQCQIHQLACRQHLTPFTLIPIIGQVVTKDGLLTLWKGSFGTGVLWGISRLTEILIGDVFGLPRNLVQNGSKEKFWRHIYLKAITIFATTPFIIASFIETVRSSTGFNLEDTKFFEVFFKGLERLRGDFFGSKDSGRRFSILYLVAPTVAFNISRFLISESIYDYVYNKARKYVSRKPLAERTRFHSILPELLGTMFSTALSDFILYPLETVVHRLYVQGTRTLIDNLDTGSSAISLTFRYTGFFHCFRSIVNREGFSSLYSGIGALGLQYTIQFMVFGVVRELFDFTIRRRAPSQVPIYNPSVSPISDQSQQSIWRGQHVLVRHANSFDELLGG